MYISIEKLIEQTKETYYETLQESSHNWYEEEMMMHHLSGICWESLLQLTVIFHPEYSC